MLSETLKLSERARIVPGGDVLVVAGDHVEGEEGAVGDRLELLHLRECEEGKGREKEAKEEEEEESEGRRGGDGTRSRKARAAGDWVELLLRTTLLTASTRCETNSGCRVMRRLAGMGPSEVTTIASGSPAARPTPSVRGRGFWGPADRRGLEQVRKEQMSAGEAAALFRRRGGEELSLAGHLLERAKDHGEDVEPLTHKPALVKVR